jgi:hypothetical protein
MAFAGGADTDVAPDGPFSAAVIHAGLLSTFPRPLPVGMVGAAGVTEERRFARSVLLRAIPAD